MRLHDSSVVLVGERVNGMPRFRLQDVSELPRLDTTTVNWFVFWMGLIRTSWNWPIYEQGMQVRVY